MLKVANRTIDDPLQVSDALGQYYADISSSRNYRLSFTMLVRDMAEHMPNFSSDNEGVYNAVFSLHELRSAISQCGNTSVGPDLIHYMFFKHMNEGQCTEILTIMNYIWCTGNFTPRSRKHSIIIPIKKPGKPTENPDANRPIQLASCFSKLLERMVTTRLMWYLYVEHTRMLNDYQSAFRKRRCTSYHLNRLESNVRRDFFYNKYTMAVTAGERSGLCRRAVSALDHAEVAASLVDQWIDGGPVGVEPAITDAYSLTD